MKFFYLILCLTLFYSSIFAQFTESQLTPADMPSKYIEMVDLDEDGISDLLISNQTSNLQFYKGNCDGNFDNPISISTLSIVSYIYAFLVRDLNNDGAMDLLIETTTSSGVKLMYALNEGPLLFSEFIEIIEHDGVYATPAIQIADITNDGLPDIVFSISLEEELYLFTNLGDGTFNSGTIVSTNHGPGMYIIETGDLDQDGDIDIVGVCPYIAYVNVFYNDGSGNMTLNQPLYDDLDYYSDLVLCDMDGDTDLDIVISDGADDEVTWLENDGLANFTTENTLPGFINAPEDIIFVDIDGDFLQDILVFDVAEDHVFWYRNQGGGEFDSKEILLENQFDLFNMYTFDLDNDGDADLILNSEQDEIVSIFTNELINENNAQVDFDISQSNILNCAGINNGFIQITFSECKDYSIQWDNADLFGFSVNNLFAGNYSYTVTDNNSNNIMEGAVFISEPMQINIELIEIINATSGMTNGTISIAVTGGTGQYFYEWTDANNNIISNEMSPSNLGEGIYSVVVIDNNGCEVSAGNFVVDNVTSLNNALGVGYFNIYPNPTSGIIKLEATLEDIGSEIKIFNFRGEIVKSFKIINLSQIIDLHSLEDGLFFLQFEKGGNLVWQKVAKFN